MITTAQTVKRFLVASDTLRALVDMSRELSCTEKRVWWADLAHQGSDDAISAPQLGAQLGLSSDQVERARRRLVLLQLQVLMVVRPGRVPERCASFPRALMPGKRASRNELMALALRLDSWLANQRSPQRMYGKEQQQG